MSCLRLLLFIRWLVWLIFGRRFLRLLRKRLAWLMGRCLRSLMFSLFLASRLSRLRMLLFWASMMVLLLWVLMVLCLPLTPRLSLLLVRWRRFLIRLLVRVRILLSCSLRALAVVLRRCCRSLADRLVSRCRRYVRELCFVMLRILMALRVFLLIWLLSRVLTRLWLRILILLLLSRSRVSILAWTLCRLLRRMRLSVWMILMPLLDLTR